MTRDEIEEARATLAFRTPGNLIAVAPRSQEGGVAIAHTGHAFARDFPAETSLRLASGDPLERLSWEDCALNAEAIMVAWNALPGLLATLDAWRTVTGADTPEALAAELNAYRASARPVRATPDDTAPPMARTPDTTREDRP